MLNFLSSIFGGGDGAIAKIATEWIETDKESAEAKAVMVKALDPSGNMRIFITKVVFGLVAMYMVTMTLLVITYSFGFGIADNMKVAIENLASLFLPLMTTSSLIVGASFGVNAMNVKTEQFKLKEKL